MYKTITIKLRTSGIILLSLLILTACSVDQVYHHTVLDKQANWVLLPVINQSQTPQAGERVEAVLASLLRSRGINHLTHYPRTPTSQVLTMLDDQSRYEAALKWASKQGFRYGITGTVEEWRYKAGLDGEPAVGITLRVIDLSTAGSDHNKTETSQATTPVVIWSATGARTGWGREGIAVATHTLLNKLLDGMIFSQHNK